MFGLVVGYEFLEVVSSTPHLIRLWCSDLMACWSEVSSGDVCFAEGARLMTKFMTNEV